MEEKTLNELNLFSIFFIFIKKISFLLISVLLQFLLLYFRVYSYYPIIVIVLFGMIFLSNNLTPKKIIFYVIGLIYVYLQFNEIMRFSIFNHSYLILLLVLSLLLDTNDLKQKKLLLLNNLIIIFYLLFGPTCIILVYSSITWIFFRFIEAISCNNKKKLPVFKNSLFYILIIVFLISMTGYITNGKCRISFDTEHKNIESANVEFKGKFSVENLTGHGGFKKYLKSLDHIELIENKSFTDKLSNSDIIFITLPTIPFAKSERIAFIDYIKNGGNAVIICEHDNMENSAAVLNDLLKDTGINFQNNIVWIKDKIKDLRFSFNPLFFRNQIHYKTGCSVKGLHKNLIFNKKNLPLAGKFSLGKGKLLCFGDSSLFQNMTYYYHYNFIKDLLIYLHFSKKINPAIIIPLILLILLQFFWLYSKGYCLSHSMISVTYYLEFIVIAVLILSFISGYYLLAHGESVFKDRNKYIAFDFSRNPKRLTAIEYDDLVNNNLDSIISFTTVHEFLPIVNENFQELFNPEKNIKGIFSIAPEIPYTEYEILKLKAYIENGGSFFLLSGVNTIHNMDLLLKKFGIKYNSRPVLWEDAGIKNTELISKIKLGKNGISCNQSKNQYFFNPCSINGVKPLFIIENNIVAGIKNIGKGKFFIFCDDSFFSNGMTGMLNKYNDLFKVNYFYSLLNNKLHIF